MAVIENAKKEFDRFIYAFKSYFCNEIVNCIPSHRIRLFLYRKLFSIVIGADTSIGMHSRFIDPSNISIGDNCAIGQFVHLDGRGKLDIGNNVNIAGHVSIYTASHDVRSPTWDFITKEVIVMDNTWIASNALILPGVTLGRGSVVAAGSVAVKSVSDYEIVGGNPAKKIGERVKEIKYLTEYFPLFY